MLRKCAGGQKGAVMMWDIDAILNGSPGAGIKLSSPRCTTRISALAVSGNQLFAGCLGSFSYPAGFVIEYLEDDGSWTRAVIIDVNTAADAKQTTYNIIANPEYDSSKNPEDFADWYISSVPVTRIRTVKNEDGLAPLKKQVQQLITSTAETIDGSVMALTTSPDDPVEVIAAGPNQIEKPAELKVFKANVESFIDAAGATLDIKSNQRFAYGLSATAYRSVADNTLAVTKTATTNLTPAWLLRKLAAKPGAGDSVSLAVDEDFETPSTIFVWDITDVATVPPVEPAWELKEHFGGVSSFYLDGTNLFSTSYDQTVCIWDISPAEQDRYFIDFIHFIC